MTWRDYRDEALEYMSRASGRCADERGNVREERGADVSEWTAEEFVRRFRGREVWLHRAAMGQRDRWYVHHSAEKTHDKDVALWTGDGSRAVVVEVDEIMWVADSNGLPTNFRKEGEPLTVVCPACEECAEVTARKGRRFCSDVCWRKDWARNEWAQVARFADIQGRWDLVCEGSPYGPELLDAQDYSPPPAFTVHCQGDHPEDL